jgi:hypothetical protein
LVSFCRFLDVLPFILSSLIVYAFLSFVQSFFLSLLFVSLSLIHSFELSSTYSTTYVGDVVVLTFRLLCFPVRPRSMLCGLLGNSVCHAEENFRNTCQ